MDQNRWFGVGRLTRPPEYFPPGRKGQEHCIFTLAINRVVPTEEGPGADYAFCSLWGEGARQFCNLVNTGDEVCVSRARLRTSLLPQADGTKRLFTEMRVEKLLLGARALKNLQPQPKSDRTTQAIAQLTKRFAGSEEG